MIVLNIHDFESKENYEVLGIKINRKVCEVMKYEYLKIIKEQGEFDFEVSAMVKELTQEEYKELKSMLITAIGSMELMRRNNLGDDDCEQMEM